jgi:hypothetical protein
MMMEVIVEVTGVTGASSTGRYVFVSLWSADSLAGQQCSCRIWMWYSGGSQKLDFQQSLQDFEDARRHRGEHSQVAMVCISMVLKDAVGDVMELIRNLKQSKISAARVDNLICSPSCRKVVGYGSNGLLNAAGYVKGINISSLSAACESCK